MPFRLPSLVLALALAAPAAWAQGAAGRLPALIAHRAVYDLALASKRDDAAIDSVRGRMVYDFSGNPCDGYALTFRQVTEVGASQGTNVSDLRTATFEDGDGRSFRFESQNYLNQRLDQAVEGRAERKGADVAVTLTKPAAGTATVGGDALFPTGQLAAILDAARAGKSTLETTIYDGSEDGRTAYHTLAVIGRKLDPAQQREGPAQARHELDGVDRWPVSLSYYGSGKAPSGEQTPIYSMRFVLYADGISDSLQLDYGDFSLKGTMAALDLLPQAACR